MSTRILAAALLGLTLAGTALPAAAQAPAGGPYVGQWAWNRGASSGAAPGEPLPQEIVLTIQAAEPGRVQWSMAAVDLQGKRYTESFAGTGDGRPAPITGAPPNTTAAYTLTATSLDAVYSNPDGSTERTSCSVSPDRRQMTCRGSESDGRGQTRDYVDVYDRR